MATPSQMIAAIEAALLTTPIGVVTIRFADGRSVQYDRKQALAELAYWQRLDDATTSATGGLQMTRCKLAGDA